MLINLNAVTIKRWVKCLIINHCKMFNAITDGIEILENAQKEAEDEYLISFEADI